MYNNSLIFHSVHKANQKIQYLVNRISTAKVNTVHLLGDYRVRQTANRLSTGIAKICKIMKY